MSCDNCDCVKCKRSRQLIATASHSSDGRVFKQDLDQQSQMRYSSPSFWCQCGAWKYNDASSCDHCWRTSAPYGDR